MPETGTAYDQRAVEYVEALGSMGAVAEVDCRVVELWASTSDDPILDAGCGPGHWTAHLASRGHDVVGIDASRQFVASARERFPEIDCRVGDVRALPFREDSFGGILAWYSFIHFPVESWGTALAECARVLKPGGTLCLGFFDGPDGEPFDHAVTRAWWRSIQGVRIQLEAAGFDVVGSHRRDDDGVRPHADVLAVRAQTVDPSPS